VEFYVPLIKDLPFIRAFNVNAAARYTEYSTVGPAVAWKIGAVWRINGQFRVRGAESRDIGAPTLSQLFAPEEENLSGFTDELTGASGTTEFRFVSNPNLKPEVARTVTFGFIYQPNWLRGASLSVDYYHLYINNVISDVFGGDPTVEKLCSEGATQYCLTVRPISRLDTSA
ncbi:TonB-dependent outer membrane receptor, partial [mine drainage metagenome]